MSKILKHTAVFTMWLACLVILAHLFIPHDHHSDTSFTKIDGACSSHKTDSGTGFPSHCNAFNDLTFDKGRTSVVINTDFPSSDFISSEVINSFTANLVGTTFHYLELRNSFENADFLELSLLRAPPSLV